MSFLKVNHDEAGGFDPIPEGVYEAIISEVKKDKAKSSGANMLKLTLTIRVDVDQPCGKRKVWDNLVESEKAMFRFHQVAKAAGLENGKPIATLEAFAKEILHKPVRIKIRHEDYEGKTQERIAGYDIPSVAYSGGVTTNDPFATPSQPPINISDDDLPF